MKAEYWLILASIIFIFILILVFAFSVQLHLVQILGIFFVIIFGIVVSILYHFATTKKPGKTTDEMKQALRFALDWWHELTREELQLVGEAKSEFYPTKTGSKLFFGFLLRRAKGSRFVRLFVRAKPLDVVSWETDPPDECVHDVFYGFSKVLEGSPVPEPRPFDRYGPYRRGPLVGVYGSREVGREASELDKLSKKEEEEHK